MVAEEGGALELQGGGGFLHFLGQFGQQFGEGKAGTILRDAGGFTGFAFEDDVEAFLHGTLHAAGGDAVLFVVLHLAAAAVIADFDQRADASGHGVGKEDNLAVDVARGASCGLDE